MLNAITRDVCPEEFERQLGARGEDPWEFRRLHRDLMAIFLPGDRADVLATQLLAQMWWEKSGELASGSPPPQRAPKAWTRAWSCCFSYSSTRSASAGHHRLASGPGASGGVAR